MSYPDWPPAEPEDSDWPPPAPDDRLTDSAILMPKEATKMLNDDHRRATPRITHVTRRLTDAATIAQPAVKATAEFPPLKRTPREQRIRPWCLYDADQGLLTMQDGSRHWLDPHGGVLAILDALGGTFAALDPPLASVIYVLAGSDNARLPAAIRDAADHLGDPGAWYKLGVGAAGWAVTYRHDDPAHRVAIYERIEQGRTVRIDLRHTAAWWGDCLDGEAIRTAHDELARRLAAAIPGAIVLGTPAQTGLDLIDRTLPLGRDADGAWHPYEYPPLDEETQALMRIGPQARVELYPPAAVADLEMPGFCYLDTRFAYAACLRHLPVWLDRHDDGIDFEPFIPGRYAVQVRVPMWWDRPGLIPCPTGPADAPGWIWPRRPGQWFASWADEKEVRLALLNGWTVHISERILFARQQTPGADPLRPWAEKMAELYYGALDRPLLQGAIKAIMRHTIGSFARREQREMRIVPEPDLGVVLSRLGPASLRPPHLTPYGWEIVVSRPLPPDRRRYQRPEWAMAIWSEQRTRLAKAMLALPPQEVIGVRTDALYTTRDPQWEDDGHIGRLRVKGWLPGPLARPQTHEELIALARESEAFR